MTNVVFHEIAWLLLGAAAVGLLGTALRQPVIVSFIAVGIAASALVDSSPETVTQIRFLAELGVALLLFLVGLKLDWRLIKTLGPVALATGLGQVAFTAGIGFPIGLVLGLDWLTSLYVAVALTFSSTIIIVKLLSDKRELETLHGRIALGFLIVQDIIVVLAMVVLSTIGVGSAQVESGPAKLLTIGGSLLGVVAALVLFVRYLADPLMARLARTPELLVIASIGWAATAAAIGDAVGLGKELGGLAAGISIGSTAYRDMVAARLSALRDFLLLFFFLSIGATLDLSTLGQDIPRAIIFSLFVLIGNPLIVILIMAWMGYRARTGFLAGLTVAQISEFSLVFMAMGLSLGHVAQSAVGLVTLVGLVTIALSVYMITYSQQLYALSKPLLRPLDFGSWREAAENDHEAPAVDVIIFGLGRFGSQLLKRLEDAGFTVLGVDLDPQTVKRFAREGYQVRFGDVTEQEFWTELPLIQARWVVLAVPYGTILLTETDPRSGLLTAIRTHRFAGRVAIAARTGEEARRLQDGTGVDLVLYPFDDAAQAAAKQITDLDEERVAKEAAEALVPAASAPAVAQDQPRVIVVGCGRVGDLLSDMLARHDVPYVALDSDSTLAAGARRGGKPVFYGDATNPELLRRFGIAYAQALVVTMGTPAAVESVVTAARAERPDLIIVARARDAGHAAKLYDLKVTDAVPEAIEASLQLSETLLVDIGIPMGLVIASIHEKRDEIRQSLQGPEKEGRVRRAIRASTRPKSGNGA